MCTSLPQNRTIFPAESDLNPQVSRYSNQTLKISDFLDQWSKGLPLVVTDVLLQGRWDPQYFIDQFGERKVTLINCETGQERHGYKVKDFFNLFLNPDARTGFWAGTWKLKV